MTKQKRTARSAGRKMWSYVTGEKGRNRIRVFAWPEKGDSLWIDYRARGKRIKTALGHSDRDRAKGQADKVAGQLGAGSAELAGAGLALRTLFDIYEREVTPTKGASARAHDDRTLPLFIKAFGAERKPETLNTRDWQSYIRRRKSGELTARCGKDGKLVLKPVRARVLEQDLKLLLAVLNWAELAREDGSEFLLARNPLRGLKVPKEESPRRPMFTADQCTTLRRVAADHSPLAERFVMLALYTGHRSGAIRQLRWSDIDLEAGVIKWRAEVDKIGYAHENPLHPELVTFLKHERARIGAIGELLGEPFRHEAWVFPSDSDPAQPAHRDYFVKKIWPALRSAAGIPEGERYGWHSFRRAFANALRNVPLRDLKDLGGWKTEQTVVAVYLKVDGQSQRAALAKLG